MRKFLIATHGSFSLGIKSSLDIIIGSMEEVYLIQAYLTENKSIEDDLVAVLKSLGPSDELVIFTDLLGGSITNQVLRHALQERVHIVSGFNLPLLIELLMGDPELPLHELIETAVQNAREQIVYVNKLIPSGKPANGDD
jgi:fructoselysine/glucoselysine PTS system EIIA component